MEEPQATRDAIGHVLAPAIDAVRTVLQRREPDDVPHRLRPVVRSSSRRLPPPLATLLLDHLEDDEELRVEASELLDGPPAALAYLAREPGWWETVAGAVGHHVLSREASARKATDRALAEAERKLDETKKRLAATQQDIQRTATRLAGVKEEHAQRLAAARARDVARIEELEREIAGLRSDLEAAAGERESLQRDLESLRRRANRSRPNAAPRPATEADFGGDPLRTARTLDLQLGMLQRRRAVRASGGEAGVPDVANEPVVLQPPAGLRATDAAWFSWLASVDTPFWLIVDGHNVVFTISTDRSQMMDAMRRLETTLRRLARVATARARITLIYDSSLAGEREPVMSERGFVVQFAPAGVTADDEVVALAHSADVYDEAVVVVTSDRELQSRVDGAAIVVAAAALAGHVTGA